MISLLRESVWALLGVNRYFSVRPSSITEKLIYQLSLDIFFLRMNKHCDTNTYTTETCFLENCFQPLYLTFPVPVVSQNYRLRCQSSLFLEVCICISNKIMCNSGKFVNTSSPSLFFSRKSRPRQEIPSWLISFS